MVLEEQIRKWQQGILNDYCKICSDTCCNPQKHRIMIDSFSLSLFQEKGISVVNIRKLDRSSLRNNQLRFKNGSYIQKPSLVQMPAKWMYGDEWYLYADSCPFYTKEKGCEAHEDSRRPEVCKKYPMLFLGCNEPEGRKLDVGIMESCECFNRKETKTALAEKFPVRVISY